MTYTAQCCKWSQLLHNRAVIVRRTEGKRAWEPGLREPEWRLLLISPHLCCGSVQFSSVAQLCPTVCDPMNRSTPGLPVHHQLPKFTQAHVHRVGDGIQPSHPLSSPSLPAPNPSQRQGLFQWVNSLHEVAKVLEFQLQHLEACIFMGNWRHYFRYIFTSCSSKGLWFSLANSGSELSGSNEGNIFSCGICCEFLVKP